MMQVIVRNVPPDPDESVSELVEHFFLVNHPEHYLTHQVKIFPQLIVQNATDVLAKCAYINVKKCAYLLDLRNLERIANKHMMKYLTSLISPSSKKNFLRYW